MNRFIIALACAGAVAACTGGNPNDAGNDAGVGTGTQPLTAEEVDETTTTDDTTTDDDTTAGVNPDANNDEIGADDDPNNIYATTANAELTANNVTYDAATDELVFNNIPFDGPANTYSRNAPANTALAGTGSSFGAYQADHIGVNGDRYFAVFRRSDAGFAQVGASGSNRYVGFGFGGGTAHRITDVNELPTSDEYYIFTGEYAAVRTTSYDVGTVTAPDFQYVSGTLQLEVDIEDFDDPGAVEGLIVNRQFFDENGIEIAAQAGADFIQLQTAEIDFDDWTIVSSVASMEATDGDNGVSGTGTWEGFFAGPNGEEVAGIVVVEGTAQLGINIETGSLSQIQIREVGGFVGAR